MVVVRGRLVVGTAEFWSIDGGVLTLDGDGVETWPPARSAVAARGHMGLAVFESGEAAALRLLVEQFDGMREAESYDHADGPLALMQGGLYDIDDFTYHGEQHALLWEPGRVGLVARAEGRSRRWFTDFAGLVRLEANEQSVRAFPDDPADWAFESLPTPGLRLLVTIPGVGVARLRTGDEAARPLRADRTRRTASGTLHTFDGERQDRLVLDAAGARLELTLLDAPFDQGAEVLASLRSVRWRG